MPVYIRSRPELQLTLFPSNQPKNISKIPPNCICNSYSIAHITSHTHLYIHVTEQPHTTQTEPFNSIDEAEQIWAELKYQLWHITNLNDLPTDQTSKDRLLYSSEWIEPLDSDTQLSLTIVGDDGQDLYLLLSNHITLDEIKEMVRNHQDNKGRKRTPT